MLGEQLPARRRMDDRPLAGAAARPASRSRTRRSRRRRASGTTRWTTEIVNRVALLDAKFDVLLYDIVRSPILAMPSPPRAQRALTREASTQTDVGQAMRGPPADAQACIGLINHDDGIMLAPAPLPNPVPKFTDMNEFDFSPMVPLECAPDPPASLTLRAMPALSSFASAKFFAELDDTPNDITYNNAEDAGPQHMDADAQPLGPAADQSAKPGRKQRKRQLQRNTSTALDQAPPPEAVATDDDASDTVYNSNVDENFCVDVAIGRAFNGLDSTDAALTVH